MEPNSHNAPFERADEENVSEYGEPFTPTMLKILAQWNECKPFWDRIYDTARRDKRFVQSRQWEQKVEKARIKQGLATVTWPLIRRFYNQQLGSAIPGSVDYRLTNTDPRPNEDVNEGVDEAVQVLNGHLQFIDKQSKAELHRNKARGDQFSGGIGWLGIDYVESDSLNDGEIRVNSPRYFDKVYAHPYYESPDASDMEYSFYFVDMAYTVAVGKFGDKIKQIKDKQGTLISFRDYDHCYQTVSTLNADRPCKTNDWLIPKNKEVRIAVHHWRRKVKRVFYVLDEKQFTESQWKEYAEGVEELEGEKPEGFERIEKIGWEVEQRTICGWTVLEEKKFFINRIPWTPIFGYKMEDGEVFTSHGIVHDAVNLQEHLNWLASQHASKAGESKTIALIKNGVLNDGFKSLGKRGNIEIYGVDGDADGTGGDPAQVIQSPDDGTKELGQMQFTMELLREVLSNTANEQSQVINSAQQLALNIQDRDSVREELDLNWRHGMELHTSKAIEMVKAVYDEDEIVKIIKLNQGAEEIGAAKISREIFGNYAVSITMSPSGTVRKQQAQQYAASLAVSQDPNEARMGRVIMLENSEMSNKEDLIKMLHKQAFAAGDFANIPERYLQEILNDQQRSGQIQQTLTQLAEPIAQQRVEQILQDANIQAQLANAEAITQKSANDVERSALGVQRAEIDAAKSIRTEQLQVMQEREQTMQDFFELQKQITQAQQQGVQIEQQLLNDFANLALLVQPPDIQ